MEVFFFFVDYDILVEKVIVILVFLDERYVCVEVVVYVKLGVFISRVDDLDDCLFGCYCDGVEIGWKDFKVRV